MSMRLTAVQRRVLFEAAQEQQDIKADWIVKKMSGWVNAQVQNFIAPSLIQLMEKGDKNLIKWLTAGDSSSLQQLGKTLADNLIRKAYETVTGEMIESKQRGLIINEILGSVAAYTGGKVAKGLFQMVMGKVGKTGVYQNLLKSVGQYISTYIRQGNIPDSISNQSKKFASFDIPDSVSQMLGPAGSMNIMRVLAILRKQPELYQSIWRMVQGMKSMGTTSSSAGTAAQRNTRSTATGTAVST